MLLELENVTYRYSDGTPALEDISIAIAPGDHLVILGANGSGKSTLLRILNGLLHPSAGSVRFRGKDIDESTLKFPQLLREFRSSVGFVFQNADAQLFNASVYEEVAYGPLQMGLPPAEVQKRVDDVLSFLGISHLAERPPFRLSGGEKRKVAIASVLSMNPQVLMFDEPFLGLDPRSQTWLVRTIRDLQRAGKTTIVATHTLDMVPKIADEVLILSEEHLVLAHGPADAVLADVAVLRKAKLIEEALEGSAL
jgi:cobalt/nickel transport system ATP-binding protein